MPRNESCVQRKLFVTVFAALTVFAVFAVFRGVCGERTEGLRMEAAIWSSASFLVE